MVLKIKKYVVKHKRENKKFEMKWQYDGNTKLSHFLNSVSTDKHRDLHGLSNT